MTLTRIAHPLADVSTTPGDSGYWIEGPTGEDIRSSWRGQPVHVLVVDALLHPRATNLPPHVQSAYIQSAMKVSGDSLVGDLMYQAITVSTRRTALCALSCAVLSFAVLCCAVLIAIPATI